ncbi:MAG: UbiA family prenyltransferase, partial [Chloroflexota bacterium]|nr:UbiA family prenyltransferase [Chloroflexota bacterium]
WPFLLLYTAFAGLSVAYSHPAIRLKAHPWASVVTVGSGQGVLAFLAGWAATRGEVGSAVTAEGLLGALAATALILTVYPLTQLYQVDEDSARGDRTIAVTLGPVRSFNLALGCLALGGAAMLVVLGRRFGAVDAALVGAALLAQAVAIAWWSRRYQAGETLANYRRVMRLNTLSAAGLSAYMLARSVSQ